MPHERRIPLPGLAVLEEEILLRVLRIEDAVAAYAVLGSLAESVQLAEIERVGKVNDLLPSYHAALVGVVADGAIAVVAVLAVVHDAPIVHGEQGIGYVVVLAGIIEVGKSERVAELVAEYAYAVGMRIDDLRFFGAGVVVGLQEFVADKASVDADALHRHAVDALIVRPDVAVATLLLCAVCAGACVVEGDKLDGALRVLELAEVHALGSGLLESLAEERVRDVHHAVGCLVAVGGIAVVGRHLRHNLERRVVEASALRHVVVLDAATSVEFVVVALLVEPSRDLLDSCRVLESAVGEIDHDYGYDGRTNGVADACGRLSVVACTIGVYCYGLRRELTLQALGAHGGTARNFHALLRLLEQGKLIPCAHLGIVCHYVGACQSVGVANLCRNGIAEVAALVLQERLAVGGHVVVEECVAGFSNAHQRAVALRIVVERAERARGKCRGCGEHEQQENLCKSLHIMSFYVFLFKNARLTTSQPQPSGIR